MCVEWKDSRLEGFFSSFFFFLLCRKYSGIENSEWRKRWEDLWGMKGNFSNLSDDFWFHQLEDAHKRDREKKMERERPKKTKRVENWIQFIGKEQIQFNKDITCILSTAVTGLNLLLFAIVKFIGFMVEWTFKLQAIGFFFCKNSWEFFIEILW